MHQARTQSNCSILNVVSLDKSFGGLTALSEVTFEIKEHLITALIGPNGAGKTTLLNVISGVEPPDRGEIIFQGRDITGLRTWKVTAMGISRTFQVGRIFHKMTVLENVLTGIHPRARSGWVSGMFHWPWEREEERRLRGKGYGLLEYFSLTDFAHELAGNIPLASQKKVEIARAMGSEPKLLLLDEPVAGLNIRETEEMGEVIRGLLDLGITVLLVEHDMNLVMSLADVIHVLHHGQLIASGCPSEVRLNPKVISAYLGQG